MVAYTMYVPLRMKYNIYVSNIILSSGDGVHVGHSYGSK